jgi:hypothetical protein
MTNRRYERKGKIKGGNHVGGAWCPVIRDITAVGTTYSTMMKDVTRLTSIYTKHNVHVSGGHINGESLYVQWDNEYTKIELIKSRILHINQKEETV